MLEKKKAYTNHLEEKIKYYYDFMHKSDINPKKIKPKITREAKKSLKNKITSYNRSKKKLNR